MAKMNMTNVTSLLGLPYENAAGRVSANYPCPSCGCTKKKLNINFERNVFRCNRCGFSGGPLDFFKYHTGIYSDSAAGTYFNRLYLGTPLQNNKVALRQPFEVPLADENKIHLVYTALLKHLVLKEEHAGSLLQRGLNSADISNLGYKSIDGESAKDMCKRLLTLGFDLEGVPGFYKESGCWQFISYGSGFLVPSRNIFGQIAALQQRMDSGSASRYMTISSSGKAFGAKGRAFPHFAAGRKDSSIILTEGALKADVIKSLTGISCLGVLGINSVAMLPLYLSQLKASGLLHVYIAYDMDIYENAHVRDAFFKLKGILAKEGLSFSQLIWDKRYKGLDDYLNSK